MAILSKLALHKKHSLHLICKTTIMKKSQFLLFACTFIASTLFAQNKPSDLLKADSSVIKLGYVKLGAPVSARFTFRNISAAAITPDRIQVSTDCTVADYSKGSLQPGQSGYAVITFTPSATGHAEKIQNIPVMGTKGAVPVTIIADVLSVADYNKQFPPKANGTQNKAHKEHKIVN